MKEDKKSLMYILVVFIIGIILYTYLVINFDYPDYRTLLLWILMSILVESLLIILPNNLVGVSLGYAIDVAANIIGGPLMVATIVPLGMLFRFPKIRGKGYKHLFNTPFYKTLYNVSQGIVASSCMGLIYIATGGTIGSFSFIPALIMLIAGMLISCTILSGLMSIMIKKSFYRVWIDNIKEIFPMSITIGFIGIIIAYVYFIHGLAIMLFFFGPLLLIRYSLILYFDILNNYMATMQIINKLIEAKDTYTSGHATRVQELSVKLANSLNLKKNVINNISTAALLHDIGKVGINDSILNKPDRLTDSEYEEIKKHTVLGAEIISGINFLKDSVDIVLYHHERYDGKGYPKCISGEQIPLEACIVSIADSYDAMTSDRPYRKAMDKETALKEIKNNAGKQFHPVLAEKFVEIMK